MVDSFKTKYFLSICIRVLLAYGPEGLDIQHGIQIQRLI